MSIVATYQHRVGKVYVHDDAFRNVAPEEMERRRNEVRRVAGEIMTRQELKKMGVRLTE